MTHLQTIRAQAYLYDAQLFLSHCLASREKSAASLVTVLNSMVMPGQAPELDPSDVLMLSSECSELVMSGGYSLVYNPHRRQVVLTINPRSQSISGEISDLYDGGHLTEILNDNFCAHRKTLADAEVSPVMISATSLATPRL